MKREKYDTTEFIAGIIVYIILGFILGAGIVGYFTLTSNDDLSFKLKLIFYSGLIGIVIGCIYYTMRLILGKSIGPE